MKIVNSAKTIVCIISKLSYKPKGYELLGRFTCPDCTKIFYIYGLPNTTQAQGSCPYCELPFELTIFTP